MEQALAEAGNQEVGDVNFEVLRLSPAVPDDLDTIVRTAYDQSDLVVFQVSGNQHNVIALVKTPPSLPESRESKFYVLLGNLLKHINLSGLQRWISSIRTERKKYTAFKKRLAIYSMWMDRLCSICNSRAAIILTPPPIESEQWVRDNPGKFHNAILASGINPAAYRLKYWQRQCRFVRKDAKRRGLAIIDLPADIFSATGFLSEIYRHKDSTHGNSAYGMRIMEHIAEWAKARSRESAEISRPPKSASHSNHPYRDRPDYAFWKQAVSEVPPGHFDPVVAPPFLIERNDRIATAGSCFAQHISRRLRESGFEFMRMEDSKSSAPDYDFSACYGNIYTSRQLLQLIERALDQFQPLDIAWLNKDGRYCDPFRPRIEARGFDSPEEVQAASKAHLAAVRRMFETLDIFIFTLGLTECWCSSRDGAVFPLAPGVAGGGYDPAQHNFVNLTVSEIVNDLRLFISKLREINQGARLILTVSPVPLVATYEDQHVMVSTTYSKSVLRVAAESIQRSHTGVYYFPAYEIITGNHSRGAYFGPDLRSVTEAGVDHVMHVFMSRLTVRNDRSHAKTKQVTGYLDSYFTQMDELAQADCDEDLLAK